MVQPILAQGFAHPLGSTAMVVITLILFESLSYDPKYGVRLGVEGKLMRSVSLI